jgi:eukaryotic-like serine/threonine-protein kinase
MTFRTLPACFLLLSLPWIVSAQEPDWTFETGGPIYSSPTLHEDGVFVGSGDGHLYALDLKTGIERWRFGTGGAVDSAPAVADGVVYVVSRDGRLHALDRSTGELRWRHATSEVVHAAPVAGGGLIYVGGFDGVLRALRPETGEVAWQFATEGNAGFPRGDIQRAAALVDGVLYFGSRDYRLYALDATNGSVLWSLEESGGWIIATPLVTATHVFFGASDGQRFYALERSTGQIAWTLPVFTRVFGTAVSVGGVVIFGGFNGKLMAVDPESGEMRWAYQTPASQALFDTVYDAEGGLTGEMREMYEDGRGRQAEMRLLELGSIPATPAVRGSMVYFGTTEGVLYALDTHGRGGLGSGGTP